MSTPWALAVVCLAAAVLLLGVLQLGLMRQVLGALEAISASGAAAHGPGLNAGEAVPTALGVTPDGAAVDVSELAKEKPLVLLFAAAQCEPCHQILAELVQHGWNEAVSLVVVIDEGRTEYDSALRDLGLLVLTDSPAGGVAQALQTNVYPNAFALRDGRVSSPPIIPGSPDDLRKLARGVAAPTPTQETFRSA